MIVTGLRGRPDGLIVGAMRMCRWFVACAVLPAVACGEPDPKPVRALVQTARIYREGCSTALRADVRLQAGMFTAMSIDDIDQWIEGEDTFLRIQPSKVDDAITIVTERSDRFSKPVVLRVPFVGPPAVRASGEKTDLRGPAVYLGDPERGNFFPLKPSHEVPPAARAEGASLATCGGGAHVREVDLRVDADGGTIVFPTCPWPDKVSASGADVISNQQGEVTLRVRPELLTAESPRSVAVSLENRAGVTACELTLVPERPVSPAP